MSDRTIDDIVETLRGGKIGRRCSVLVGAGCSKSAGIPLASEIVKEIEKSYPAAYSRALAKDYPNSMAALDMGVRRDLIARYVDRAKINWAHIGLAQVIARGHVDRVLTTNFDPLIARACALINVFPAVYDLAASHVFKPDQVSGQAIFHLHGQRDGFVLLNTAG
jgi:NAD-dependent SIR2 family protein deacetylase